MAVDRLILRSGLGLELAEKGGMDETTAARVADALATDLPPVIRAR